MESVHKLKTERHQQGDAEQNVGHRGCAVHGGEVVQQMRARIGEADDQHDGENDHADLAGGAPKVSESRTVEAVAMNDPFATKQPGLGSDCECGTIVKECYGRVKS